MPEYQTYTDVLAGACPFGGDTVGGAQTSTPTLQDWYPDRLRVEQLHRDGAAANPLADLDYPAAFATIDLPELKADIKHFLTTSVSWWPSDYGNYGPQMVRMAWHAAGTYRIADGRGGAGQAMQRFAPISSWWDNGNTDKSRRLLWPIKQKYGSALSWADLMILTGNCALEIMGLPTHGFGGGRRDAWEADDSTYWGPEYIDNTNPGSFDAMVMRSGRWTGEPGDADYALEQPLAASHQSLIYVNPEGPNANGDPAASAVDIRITFGRMAMNDEETVALIAGGHAFGKSHGKVAADEIGPPPEIAPMEAMGLGWQNPEGTGFAEYTMTNGIEGSWTPNPTQWDNTYLENLFGFEWKQSKSPAGAIQWTPSDEQNSPRTPDAHLDGVVHPLMMMTSDIALKVDPVYREVCLKFLADFDAFTDAFSKAWFKLTHRDMGPKSRYLGPEVNTDELPWQDPLPAVEHPLVGEAEVARLKRAVLDAELSVSDLAFTAFSSAATYRDTDKRGGANGARLTLAPQKDWTVNRRTVDVVAALRRVMDTFNAAGPARISREGGGRGRAGAVHPRPRRRHRRPDRRPHLRVAGPRRRRLPRLRAGRVRPDHHHRSGADVPRPGRTDEAHRPGVGRSHWRSAGVGLQPRLLPQRGLHRPGRHAQHRLLHDPDEHGLRVAQGRRGRHRVHPERPGQRCDGLPGHPQRPAVRLQHPAARRRRGVRRQ
jgi:catalase-peroxidase